MRKTGHTIGSFLLISALFLLYDVSALLLPLPEAVRLVLLAGLPPVTILWGWCAYHFVKDPDEADAAMDTREEPPAESTSHLPPEAAPAQTASMPDKDRQTPAPPRPVYLPGQPTFRCGYEDPANAVELLTKRLTEQGWMHWMHMAEAEDCWLDSHLFLLPKAEKEVTDYMISISVLEGDWSSKQLAEVLSRQESWMFTSVLHGSYSRTILSCIRILCTNHPCPELEQQCAPGNGWRSWLREPVLAVPFHSSGGTVTLLDLRLDTGDCYANPLQRTRFALLKDKEQQMLIDLLDLTPSEPDQRK